MSPALILIDSPAGTIPVAAVPSTAVVPASGVNPKPCQPYQRDRLERLCRYVTRPAICMERLAVRADGQIQYELKNPFSNGTTHILFSPLDFLSKLAALIPRPRHNLVRYHGVFAPNAKIRKLIVPKNNKTTVKKVKDKGDDKKPDEAASQDELVAPLTWAQRLKRVSLCALFVGGLCVSLPILPIQT